MSKQVIAIITVVIIIIAGGFLIKDADIRSNSKNGSEILSQDNSGTGTRSELGNTEAQDPSMKDAEKGDREDKSLTTNSEKKMYTQATLKTNMGDIVITFDTATPNTVGNFTKLAQAGFYNGIKFHRIIKDFMIQGGDPLTKDDSKQALWGTGGPGYQFADEIKPTNNNVKGTIAMANAGPNTNGSQFFINVADNTFLNGKHTVFGHVTSGYDLVVKMSQVATTPNDRPIDPIVINSVELK
jgi:peptidylprolyl isomerase